MNLWRLVPRWILKRRALAKAPLLDIQPIFDDMRVAFQKWPEPEERSWMTPDGVSHKVSVTRDGAGRTGSRILRVEVYKPDSGWTPMKWDDQNQGYVWPREVENEGEGG